MIGAELIPTLFILLLGAGIIWIIWRVVRRLFRSPAPQQEPPTLAELDANPHRHEPGLPPIAAPSSIPDAADVLALKAAIDNLARQVDALEQRLASGELKPLAAQLSPPATLIERAPASEPPSAALGHRL